MAEKDKSARSSEARTINAAPQEGQRTSPTPSEGESVHPAVAAPYHLSSAEQGVMRKALLRGTTPVPSTAHSDSKWEQFQRVLDEVEDYLENRQDVRDGSYGEQRPNEEMSLLTDLRWWRIKESPRSSVADIESLKVTLGCCLALMAQSGNEQCREMARRIPFTINNGEPYALIGDARSATTHTMKP